MPRYLDPKIDLAFKRVFGEHAHLLKSFLNALLPLPDDGLIESLQYLTPEQVPDIPGLLKNSIVDVKCTDVRGRVFIVEMQMLWTPSFTNRIVFSAAQAYVKQLKSGEHYRALQPVYALALLNDRFDHKTDEFYHHYQIVNVQNSDEKLQGLEFVIVELPKFKAGQQPGPSTTPQMSLRTARRMQTLWLRFLSEVAEDTQGVAEELRSDSDIAEALGLVEVGAYTAAELDSYHSGLDRVRVEQTYIADALAEGEAKGKAEMIHAMHASGMAVEQIAAIAQLGVAEVRHILGDGQALQHWAQRARGLA